MTLRWGPDVKHPECFSCFQVQASHAFLQCFRVPMKSKRTIWVSLSFSPLCFSSPESQGKEGVLILSQCCCMNVEKWINALQMMWPADKNKQTNKRKEKKRKKDQIPFSLHFNFSPTKTKMSCFENENLLSAFRASVKPDGRLIFANDLPRNRPYKILMDWPFLLWAIRDSVVGKSFFFKGDPETLQRRWRERLYLF